MNWFSHQRQEWITESLKVYGFITRAHLMRKFEISNAQAALDIRAFNMKNPTAMEYDKRKKAYIASDAP